MGGEGGGKEEWGFREKQEGAYEIVAWLEFQRVIFRFGFRQ